jgi:pimeloyl-ACP methyl ester carboxylesterase
VPLDLKVIGETWEPETKVRDIEYSSEARRVSALLVEPVLTLPVGKAVFLHPAPGDRASFLPDARILAARGISSLLINAPWADPQFGQRLMELPAEAVRDLLAGAVVDVRRGVDLLTSGRANAGVALVGHSLGAMIGGLACASDHRLKAAVLMAGVGRFEELVRANVPDAHREWLDSFRKTVGPLDPIDHVRNASDVSFLFQIGLDDRSFSRASFVNYYDAASGPKEIVWYEADHYGIAEAGRADRIEWLDVKISTING